MSGQQSHIDSLDTKFRSLVDQASRLQAEGELRSSLSCIEQSAEIARLAKRKDLLDWATCNRAILRVELQEGPAIPPELRRILMGSADSKTRYLAAYNLSYAYERTGDQEKAFFYTEIAQHHAEALGAADQLVCCHHRRGSLLLARSELLEAEEEFLKALALDEEAVSSRRVILLDYLGYCHVLRGNVRKGFRALFESLRLAVRQGLKGAEIGPRISLAFAYNQIGRHNVAIRHSRIALGLAEQSDWRPFIKTALFVLGEAEKLSGNPLAARASFLRLQEQFYPEAPNVPDLLLLLNVQNFVNIKV